MQETVTEYVRSGGALLRPHGLGDFGGWYCADFPRDQSLRHLLAAIDEKPVLHKVLSSERVLNTTSPYASRSRLA